MVETKEIIVKEKPGKIPRIISDSKTISIEYSFGPFDDLKMKLRAKRDEWLNLWAEHDFDNVKFEEIVLFLCVDGLEKVLFL